MDLGLRGRAALVAASSRGIGRAIAVALAGEGADVAMCARDAEALEAAAVQVRAGGSRVVTTVADLAHSEGAEAAVAAAVSELGRLDILVVNAGGPPYGGFNEIDDATWQQAFELTFLSAVRLIRAALPALRASDAASVTVVTSTSVRKPIGGLLTSNALRPAVTGLAASLAVELAPGVRVNTLMPGRILTDRTRSLAAQQGQDVDAVIARQAELIPLRRYGDAAEFARVAAFVCSPAASYLTGCTIPVDGGLLGLTV